MSGELYRVPADRLREMLAEPDLVREEVYPDDSAVYEARRAERGLDIDKAWDGLHFLVRGLIRRGRIPWIDPVPWHAPAEGSETGAENHYCPELQVRSITSWPFRPSRPVFSAVSAPRVI